MHPYLYASTDRHSPVLRGLDYNDTAHGTFSHKLFVMAKLLIYRHRKIESIIIYYKDILYYMYTSTDV